MRLQKYINEEYLTRVKDTKGESYEIFINPSFKEMMEIGKNQLKIVRFIAYKKDFYAWYGWKMLVHATFWQKHMKRDIFDDAEKLIVFPGVAEKQGSKFVLENADDIINELLDTVNYKIEEDKYKEFMKRFQWVNKYVDISLLRKMLDEYWN